MLKRMYVSYLSIPQAQAQAQAIKPTTTTSLNPLPAIHTLPSLSICVIVHKNPPPYLIPSKKKSALAQAIARKGKVAEDVGDVGDVDGKR